jgi:hypothetical protein
MRPAVALLLVMLGLAPARPALALFRLAVIDEIATSIGGDERQQFVEVRMLAAGQTQVRNSVLAAFDGDGHYLGDVLVVPSDLPIGGAGKRWLLATAVFQQRRNLQADFTIPAGALPVQNGMICWGAPGAAAPDPSTWDHSDPSQYVDCVAYGGFCGTSPAGLPVTATPVDHSLARVGTSNFSNQDFACASILTPQNDAGVEHQIAGIPCGPVPAVACGRALAGGAPIRNDCLGEWLVLGATSSRPVVVCRDGDPTCDTGTGRGCLVRVELCFADASNALYAGRCRPPTFIDKFRLVGAERDDTDRNNDAVIAGATTVIGGRSTSRDVAFTTPLATMTCTPPFTLSVPLRHGARRGGRTFRSVTRAGVRVDRDTLRLVCTP